MSLLSDAILVAATAHDGQTDRAGEPYILHPLRVMLDPILRTEQERVVGVLHDVLEDSPGTSIQYFGRAVCEAVASVTRRPNETYQQFIDRCAENDIGRRVKIADLRDNLLRWRLEAAGLVGGKLESRYRRALETLGAEA